MPDMSKEQLEARKKIEVRGLRGNVNAEFLHEIFKAFKEGYEPAPLEKMWRKDAPVFKNNRKTVYLYPQGFTAPSPTEVVEGKSKTPQGADKVVVLETDTTPATEQEVVDSKVDLKEVVEALSSKKDLLDKAKELGIDVPEDKKQPKAIKQYMLNSLKEE